ncbi:MULTISPECIES: 2OG-Fe(II) oxygenase [Priestia]|uniref:2OG-Fe(II) oxygenase n=1 Tax=Priestia TaxID=2800373 RepID=UPI0005ED3E87|nr:MULTISPECIES: 2OG-Fe(II) oxygenase [Priestia]KJL04692.1 2OG-Fe(II) oxygenase [Priestia aryabhattai B8W22]MBX4162401.1 2OG-Fe(II) oxygenase [Priestia megaterium]MED3896315.1 2OG-Fe(II) oxygenase [Priestia aryabhattai]
MILTNTSLLTKEQTIFSHSGNKIKLEDREIDIVARFEEPLVLVLGNVLSNEECDELIQLSKDKMQRSKIGAAREVNSIRTSSGMFFEESENELVHQIERRLSKIMGPSIEYAEGLQVLKYLPDQEYKAHHDYFTSASKASKNNRISTLVMYLNDVEEGGETYFPKLGLSVSPAKGMAVYFEYFYSDAELNDRTLHGGAPVIKGEKWVATQWMRKQKIRS